MSGRVGRPRKAKPAKEVVPRRTAEEQRERQALWVSHYLNPDNPATFLNVRGASKAVGYSAQAGYELLKRAREQINAEFDKIHLSKERLKCKLIELLDAKEVKFFVSNGEIVETIEVPALETQRKALDMAIRIRGMYAATKQEVSGPGGESLTLVLNMKGAPAPEKKADGNDGDDGD